MTKLKTKTPQMRFGQARPLKGGDRQGIPKFLLDHMRYGAPSGNFVGVW